MRLRAVLQLLTVGLFCGEFAVAQAALQAPAECSAYAAVALPVEAQSVVAPTASPACASYKSYRGIGRPVNYAAARACAWKERLAQKAGLGQNQKEPTAWVVGGSLILADIYANGAGVARNMPLAMRFACEYEAQTVSLALPEMQKLAETSHPVKRFELCEYAATTFTENFCMGADTEVAEDRRGRYYNSLKHSMTAEQKAAFDRLLAAKTAYIVAHADEVDQGGSIRTIRTMGSQGILEDLFRTEVTHFEQKKWPALSKSQIEGADVLLKRQYAATMQKLKAQPHEDGDGAVTTKQLAGVQLVWAKYRDAWGAFARVRYPDAVDAIRAQIVLDRYRWLKTM